ncbi:motility associated factor glycosyltransferase family protein [Magnetovibrio blakemorei]|uniref:DUF115 domain-containing protein n=1 Tax=Magnetovibrio blakemorei TaxID=28181 RepID=A0A1E5Q9J0_9PROT|nr:6-hydroxymethylpterin diphosphokinase MptE-like protein [Magnetovibrio blakemorei]OEJ68271.1 hypothetical protein BEN30_06585 [Magnetovibrio blakemorei]
MTGSEDIFEQNLVFFKEINPVLAERLATYKALSTLEFDGDGEPDVVFQGMKLYGKGAQKYAAEQIEAFWKSPSVITLTRKSIIITDSEATKLLNGLLQFADDNAITFSENRTTRNAFHLVVLGAGLGQHMQSLLEDVQPRNLILVEPNFEFLYQSLFTFNWNGVIRPIIEDGGNVHLLVDSEPKVLISEVRRIYSEYGRASIDGLTVYRHYENPAFTAVEQFLATQGDKLFSGLGFFEDEINMIANTYNNLKGGQEKVFYAHSDLQDFPIFVVGSGPSLDGSIDVIRANQERAVIVSCGTALLPLLRAGITPDFHAELERSKYQMEIPKGVAEEFDLSQIYLLGSTTLVPGVKQVFEKRIFYFRHLLSSFPAFSGELRNCLRYPSPTVGNTGISFAEDIGFRLVYLFGMDLGFADPTVHHSENSVYRKVDGRHNFGISPWDRVVPGNFGGEVKSTSVMQWARDTLEVSIANCGLGRIFYNCSDGSLIEGSVPLLPEFVDLPEPHEPKKVCVQRIVDGFPNYSDADFESHWQDGKLIQDVRAVGDRMIERIEKKSDLKTKKYITELMKIVRAMEYDDSAISLMRGSVYLLLVIGEHHLDRVVEDDKKDDLVAYIRKEYVRLIDSMCDEVAVEFSSLEKTGALVNRETVWA